MVSFIDANGQRQQIDLGGMSLIREATKKRISVRQLINQKFPTAAGQPETFKQFCVSAGLRFKRDEETGVPAANLLEVFDPLKDDPKTDAAGASFTNDLAVPDSRWLFMPALMAVIEDSLQSKEDIATGAFESLVGYRQTVASNRVEQPVISYGGKQGPEDSQFQQIAQNTRPALMLSLSASDISRKIPTTSIGMEISYEALASNSIDYVALTLARFFKKANYAQWIEQIGYLLSGDPDAAVTAMSAATSALPTTTAKSLDSTISADGVLTQLSYMKWLYQNSLDMTKTHAIMDFDTAYAMDTRTNRPTNVQDNAMDRLDVPFQVIYPAFQRALNVVVMPSGTFTANYIMGLDQQQAIAKITSSSADYQAYEDVIMKKSTQLRMDRGFITYRMYDDAFDVLRLEQT